MDNNNQCTYQNIVKEVLLYVKEIKYDEGDIFKVGEGSVNRINELDKKYNQLRNVTCETVYEEVLPHNNERRLNDKTIHKHLSKLKPVNKYRVKGLLNEDDGYTEFFERSEQYPNLDVVSYIKDVVAELSTDSSNFKVKNKAINNIKLIYGKTQKHEVPNGVIIKILNFLSESKLNKCADKKILLIGQFLPDWVATFALNNNVYIWHDSEQEKHVYGFAELNTHIKYINDLKELMEMNEKFDLIIANPPYDLGSKITKSIIDNVSFTEFVNLMPFSKYKSQHLYKHITKVELVDPKLFEDAIITDNLCICSLTDEEQEQTLDEIELQTYDTQYSEFYRLNKTNDEYITNINHLGGSSSYKLSVRQDLPIELSFAITSRTCCDGVHKTPKAFDYKWNVLEQKDYSLLHTYPQGGVSAAFIYFNNKKELDNFITFWYKNSLMHELIKGLNKVAGTPRDAIPNIDWSVDRDYEHLTYDELLNIMKSERGNK